MKINQILNLIYTVVVLAIVTSLNGCYNNIGGNGSISGGITYIGGNTFKTASGGFPNPLTVEVVSHDASGSYVSNTDTSMYTMVKFTNNTNSKTPFTNDPLLGDSTNFMVDESSSHYPVGTHICHMSTGESDALVIGGSCSLLIKALATSSGDNLSTTLTLFTNTYRYVFNLTIGQILYMGGNFSDATSTGDSAQHLTAFNTGNCGVAESKACMLISYNPNTNEIKKIAETDDEIYGLAADSDGNLIVGGAFTSITTNNGVISLPGNSLSSTLVARINPLKESASIYAKANQAVYTITSSPSATNQNTIYLAGAFNTLSYGNNFVNSISAPNQGCLVASKSTQAWNNLLSANGFVTSMTTSAQGMQDNLLTSGSFENISGVDLLESNNYTGIASCVGINCRANPPIAFNARSNVIALTPDNKIITSGDYSSIDGVASNVKNGDIEISNSAVSLGAVKWAKVNTTTADLAVHTILATNSDYYLGGSFATINNLAKLSGGNCGSSGTSKCLLAKQARSSSTSTGILYTDSHINAITSGTSLSVTLD